MTDEAKPTTHDVESIPSVEGGISALASASAPFVYFDAVSNFGFKNGVVHMTLEVARHMSTDGTHIANDRVVVAHLRMSAVAFNTLKGAVAGIELLAQPQDEKSVN